MRAQWGDLPVIDELVNGEWSVVNGGGSCTSDSPFAIHSFP